MYSRIKARGYGGDRERWRDIGESAKDLNGL